MDQAGVSLREESSSEEEVNITTANWCSTAEDEGVFEEEKEEEEVEVEGLREEEEDGRGGTEEPVAADDGREVPLIALEREPAVAAEVVGTAAVVEGEATARLSLKAVLA